MLSFDCSRQNPITFSTVFYFADSNYYKWESWIFNRTCIINACTTSMSRVFYFNFFFVILKIWQNFPIQRRIREIHTTTFSYIFLFFGVGKTSKTCHKIKHWACVCDRINHSFFNRFWIWQEVFYSQEVTLIV